MKVSKGWFILGALITAHSLAIRILVEQRVVQTQGYSAIIGIMDLTLTIVAITAFGVFYSYSRNRWADPKKLGFSQGTYSFSNGVLTVLAAFMIATMVYKLSGL